MKKWFKSILLVMCIIGILGGCSMNTTDNSTMLNEQDRIVEFIYAKINLVDGSSIKKIEFIEFQKNETTGTWRIVAKINDSYAISFKENELGEAIRIGNYSPKEFRIEESNDKKEGNFTGEIVYYQ